jgi:hypothetical protein
MVIIPHNLFFFCPIVRAAEIYPDCSSLELHPEAFQTVCQFHFQTDSCRGRLIFLSSRRNQRRTLIKLKTTARLSKYRCMITDNDIKLMHMVYVWLYGHMQVYTYYVNLCNMYHYASTYCRYCLLDHFREGFRWSLPAGRLNQLRRLRRTAVWC